MRRPIKGAGRGSFEVVVRVCDVRDKWPKSFVITHETVRASVHDRLAFMALHCALHTFVRS